MALKHCGKHDINYTQSCWCCDAEKTKEATKDEVVTDIDKIREEYQRAFDAAHK
jgi:hypothetical protein